MRAPRALLVGLATLGLCAGVMPSAHADTTTDTYIVQLKSTVSASSVASTLLPSDAKVLGNVHVAVAELTAAKAAAVANNPNVKSVRKDFKVTSSGQEIYAPWNIDLLDNRTGSTDTTYNYPNTGTGVTVYVIDSGLKSHAEFNTAHILPGINFVPSVPVSTCDNTDALPIDPLNTTDDAGHGTAVSSLIVGANDGVAKDASIIPVKVLDKDGLGCGSWFYAAVDWVLAHHTAGTPAVANMSLGTSGDGLSAPAQDLINDGITVVAAAGNESADACRDSPAMVPAAITVAAVTPSLTEPVWPDGQSTNYGPCVDLYAPGDQVVAANYLTSAGSIKANGTSFSTPLVSGAAALVLAQNPSWTPAQVSADLSNRATYGVVKGNRSVNKLVNVGPLGTFSGTAPTITPGVRVDDFASVQLHWSPTPLTATYQWYLDGVPIQNATAATYKVLLSDQGKSLTVAVTGSYPGYVGVSGISPGVVVAPPPPAGMVTPLAPTRLMDTRTGQGASGPLVSGRTVILHVAGVAGVSKTASAVLVNITCTDATAGGFITGYASGTPKPGVSNANFTAGKTGANLALIPVGADGSIALTAAVNGGTVQLIVDLQGFVTGGGNVTEPGAVKPVPPKRLADTRATGSVAGGGTLHVKVTDGVDVPADAAAVFLNVTVTSPGTPGFLTAYPTAEPRPTTSNLNFVPGQTVPNMVLVKVGTDGFVSIFNAAATAVHVIVDIQGFVTFGEPASAGAVKPISPTRVMDTRVGLGAPPGAVVSGTTRTVQYTPPVGTASGVFMNLTVTETTASGFISAYPASGTRPTISNLNFAPGATVPNLASVGLTGSQATVFVAAGTYGSVQLVADVFAYIL